MKNYKNICFRTVSRRKRVVLGKSTKPKMAMTYETPVDGFVIVILGNIKLLCYQELKLNKTRKRRSEPDTLIRVAKYDPATGKGVLVNSHIPGAGLEKWLYGQYTFEAKVNEKDPDAIVFPHMENSWQFEIKKKKRSRT